MSIGIWLSGAGGRYPKELCDECLNEYLFSSLWHTRGITERWRDDYNHTRPHSAIRNIPPAEYARQPRLDKQAASGTNINQELSQKPEGTRVSGHFFNLLKRERIRRGVCKTRLEARQDVFDYIEMFYNPKRKHTTNGMLSPVDFERQQIVNQQGVLKTRGNSV